MIHGAGADGAVDAVAAAADRKHEANDAKCDALGWQCVPLAVDSYGRWGVEAHKSFAQIATHIQTRNGGSLSAAYSSVYNTLGVVLTRHNARAVLARRSNSELGAREVRLLGGVGLA